MPIEITWPSDGQAPWGADLRNGLQQLVTYVNTLGGGDVDSVNGKTGIVTLDPGDIGAATAESVSTLQTSVTDLSDEVQGVREILLDVESFVEPGDTSDSQAWQRAVNTAKTLTGSVAVTINAARTYEMASSVALRGAKNLTIRGGARFRAKAGSGEISSLFTIQGGVPTPTPGNPGGFALGDSLTATRDWVTQMNRHIATDAFDGGQAGQTTTEMRFRYAAPFVTVTFPGD